MVFISEDMIKQLQTLIDQGGLSLLRISLTWRLSSLDLS